MKRAKPWIWVGMTLIACLLASRYGWYAVLQVLVLIGIFWGLGYAVRKEISEDDDTP